MKSIFLVNPISGQGHLDSYARLYSRVLLELGYRVVLVAATDGGTIDYLGRNNVDRSHFSFVPFSAVPPPQPAANDGKQTQTAPRVNLSTIKRAKLVWQEEGPAGVLRRLIVVPERMIAQRIPDAIRTRWRTFKRASVGKLAHYRAVRATWTAFFPDAGRIYFTQMMQNVRNASVALGNERPDLVFFLYLDLMAEGPTNIAALDAPDCWPWAGIRFHPRLRETPEASAEKYFKSTSARGGVFLVPQTVEIYAEAVPRLNFVLAPDVADLEQAAELPPIAKEIRDGAAGRTIILQVGTIAPHKGVMTLLDIIATADPKRFFFALVGEVYWKSFGENEQRLRNFYASTPENVFVHDGYLADERDYNSLIAACDVVYAVYTGFNSSSNSLTKAAGLQRPILAAKNSLMGDRVVAHGIGLAVTNNDGEIVAALDQLSANRDAGFRFNSYANHHSLNELKSVMAKSLPLWIAEPRALVTTSPTGRFCS